jgi:hypothetical protein
MAVFIVAMAFVVVPIAVIARRRIVVVTIARTIFTLVRGFVTIGVVAYGSIVPIIFIHVTSASTVIHAIVRIRHDNRARANKTIVVSIFTDAHLQERVTFVGFMHDTGVDMLPTGCEEQGREKK